MVRYKMISISLVFKHSKRNFVSPRGHLISSIYLLFTNLKIAIELNRALAKSTVVVHKQDGFASMKRINTFSEWITFRKKSFYNLYV